MSANRAGSSQAGVGGLPAGPGVMLVLVFGDLVASFDPVTGFCLVSFL